MELKKREIPINQIRVFVGCFIVDISEDNEENKPCKSHFPLILFVWKLVVGDEIVCSRERERERDGGQSVRLNIIILKEVEQ